jgi:hypothetical protein
MPDGRRREPWFLLEEHLWHRDMSCATVHAGSRILLGAWSSLNATSVVESSGLQRNREKEEEEERWIDLLITQ